MGGFYDKMTVVALWRSGYAAVCKTVYTGSIPVGASSDFGVNRRLTTKPLFFALTGKEPGTGSPMRVAVDKKCIYTFFSRYEHGQILLSKIWFSGRHQRNLIFRTKKGRTRNVRPFFIKNNKEKENHYGTTCLITARSRFTDLAERAVQPE